MQDSSSSRFAFGLRGALMLLVVMMGVIVLLLCWYILVLVCFGIGCLFLVIDLILIFFVCC